MRDVFSIVSLKLVVEQPFKIPFVAAVALFAHADKKETVQDLVNAAGSRLQEYLDKGQWRESKLMLRFLACLSRVFEDDGIMSILDELFNRAVDLQTASSEDAVGLELVKIILLTIPYLLAYADDVTLPQKVAELLEKTDIVASTKHELEPLVDPYPTLDDDAERPMICPSVISLLQRQLQDEANYGWPLRLLPRIYDPSLKPSGKLETNDDASEMNGNTNGITSVKVAFPPITVPSPINAGSRTLLPEIYFSLYADQEIESVPSITSIASTLLRDACVDTINLLDFNRNNTAKYLNEIDCFWTPDTFAKRSLAFDKLRDVESGRPTWKPEDVAIDAIFSQIFALPSPEHRLVYYHSIITESCRISPQAIAPSLGRAIRFLFRGIDVMDLELAYRYMDWFAHHLSNFEFRWKWTEWISDLALPSLDPKKSFIAGLLDKEIRLSFAKRIRETLPPEFHDMIPPSKEKDIPDFKFQNDSTPFALEGRQVLALLKRKAPEDEIQSVLDHVQQQAIALGMDQETALAKSTDIYVTAILSIGAKSLSHVLSTIDRCKERLLAIGPSSEIARRQIISSVVDFWHEHPGTAVNIVDKLLNYTIVTPMGVIQWALADNVDHGKALASPQIYEMINITMFKVTNRVHQLLQLRNNIAAPFEQRQQIDEALPRERHGMRELFQAIEDAVSGEEEFPFDSYKSRLRAFTDSNSSGIAAGAQDGMIEVFDGQEAEFELIKTWGARWARVWRRKNAVEEMIVSEAMGIPIVEPAAVPLPAMDGGDDDLADGDMDQIS